MINVLVDAHSFDGAGQGVVTYIEGLYREIIKNNDFKVTFCAVNIEKIKNIFGEEAKYIKLKSDNFFYRNFYFFPKILGSGKFNVAHFQYIIPFFINSDVFYVVTIHDIIPIDFPKFYSMSYKLKVAWLFRRAAKKSSFIFTVSEYSKCRIAKRFKIPCEKISITVNAVKSSLKGNAQLLRNRPYFLYVSRMEERKNHIFLIKAFFENNFDLQFDLVMIGSSLEKNKRLVRFLNSLDKEKRKSLVLLNNLSDEELGTYYKTASLFIYPSIAEGFGIPPLEAALLNVKVVCSNSTAMKSFDFFEKYSFNPNDKIELVEKIKLALAVKDYPYEKIKCEILSRYGWEKSASEYMKVIKAIVT